jgi:hypothetical protein
MGIGSVGTGVVGSSQWWQSHGAAATGAAAPGNSSGRSANSSGGSKPAPYVPISQHVLVQKSDPHYAGMLAAWTKFTAGMNVQDISADRELRLWNIVCQGSALAAHSPVCPQGLATLASLYDEQDLVAPGAVAQNDSIFLVGSDFAGVGGVGELDADDVTTLYKALRKGQTAKVLNQGFDPADYPGDSSGPESNFPNGRAYFGIGSKGKEIALDYASYGSYDDIPIKIDIPTAIFNNTFGRYVGKYDGAPDAEVAIPSSMFPELNGFRPTLLGPEGGDGAAEGAGGE